MLAFTVAGVALLVVAYAVGIGGTVGALLALAAIFTGALLEVARPLIERLKP